MKKFDFEKYEKDFRNRPTSQLIKGYKHYNQSYKAKARAELNKRKVPVKQLPYKKITRKSNNLFDYNYLNF